MKSKIWITIRTAGLFAREFVGWLLVVVSLYLLGVFDLIYSVLGLKSFLGTYSCFFYLQRGLVIEGSVLGVIGVMLFRGGLQLVKVAVAARAFRTELPE